MAEYRPTDKELSDARDLIRSLRDAWTDTYTIFSDYRRMADGGLPKTMSDILESKEYARRSKLKPRLIVDAIKDLVSYSNHTIFHNTDGAYNFIPVGDDDEGKAEKAKKLVDHGVYYTGAKMVCKSIARDAAIVGIGYGMINQHSEDRLVPKSTKNFLGKIFNVAPSMERREIYSGAKLKRLLPESVFPQKVKQWEDVSAIARIYLTPISYLINQTVPGGLLERYSKEIRGLKRTEVSDPDEQFNIYKENEGDQFKDRNIRDFRVKIGELWQLAMYGGDKFPTWYRLWIADFDNGDRQEPLVIGFQKDPMKTGYHNILRAIIFPNPDRINGYAVPEMLKDLNLEMFYKRNQVIDYVNLLMAVHGTIWGKDNGLPKDDIVMKIGKYKSLKTGNPKELHTVTLDVTPVTAAYQEIGLIKRDVEETMAQNKISSGKDPIRREAATIGAIIDENAKIRQTDPIEELEESLIKPMAMSYLVQAQIFMTSAQRIRILGKNGWEWEMVEPSDIQGAFDVECVASSQIIPRAMKQANANAIINTFGNNPYLAPKLDWGEVYKAVCDLMEWPQAKKFLKDPTMLQEEIQREEDFMLETGMVWIVLPSEDDVAHLNSHMQRIAGIDNGKMHIQDHLNSMKIKQGQIGGVGQQTSLYTNQGEALNDMASTNAPKAIGR